MKPPYSNQLADALKVTQPTACTTPRYAHILRNPKLIADFVGQRLASKRKWYGMNRGDCCLRRGEKWQDMVLRVVYKNNLSVTAPRDGKVICRHGRLLIIDWQSWCPVLTYCAQTGQATVPVCSILYHMQLQHLLSLVLPGALFTRDYSRIRPGSCSCREYIYYDGKLAHERVASIPMTQRRRERNDTKGVAR